MEVKVKYKITSRIIAQILSLYSPRPKKLKGEIIIYRRLLFLPNNNQKTKINGIYKGSTIYHRLPPLQYPINQYHEKLCAYIRKIRAAEILEVDFSIGFLDFMLSFTSKPPAEFLSLISKKKERNYFTSS